MSSVLSIDVGTSGVRAALFDEDGNEVPGAQVRTSRSATVLDFAQLDPDDLVDEVINTVDQLLAPHTPKAQIELIAISTFWHSLLGIDSDGRPTTPLLTWADTRASHFANELRVRFNEAEFHARTGCAFHPSYWPAKLLWMKHELNGRFYRTTHRWLGFAEYLCLRLFGDHSISVSMASATGLFNQRTFDWDTDLVQHLGIAPDTLPELKTQTSARLTPAFASRWPALAEARLVTIVGDGAANNIGVGCSTKDKTALMVGTSGAMRVVFAGEPPWEISPRLWCYRVNLERVVVGGALSDGGGLLQWLTESLNLDHDRDKMQMEIAALEPDAHGLTVLPFWSGERSTGWLADARGGIFGLRLQTKPVEIVRAVLEAIAYRFALIARALDDIAPAVDVYASGNALRAFPQWSQILADVLGRPFLFSESTEASSRGAALLALEAVGKIESIEKARFEVGLMCTPDEERHDRYLRGLARQQKFYERLKEYQLERYDL